MAKTISDKLLKRGIDPLPGGPTVFSHRLGPKPTDPSTNCVPLREQFESAEEYEEALGFWRSRHRGTPMARTPDTGN